MTSPWTCSLALRSVVPPSDPRPPHAPALYRSPPQRSNRLEGELRRAGGVGSQTPEGAEQGKRRLKKLFAGRLQRHQAAQNSHSGIGVGIKLELGGIRGTPTAS